MALGTAWLGVSQLTEKSHRKDMRGESKVSMPMPSGAPPSLGKREGRRPNLDERGQASSSEGVRPSRPKYKASFTKRGDLKAKSPNIPVTWRREDPSSPLRQNRIIQRAHTVTHLIESARMKKRLGDFKKAEELLKEALKRDPRCVEALVNLGNLYLREMGRPKQALTLYKRALSIDPNRVSIHVNLGVYYMERGQWDLSRYHLEKAGRLNPSLPQVPYNLACLAARRGDLSGARRELQRAISLDPRSAKWAESDTDLAPLREESGRASTLPREREKAGGKPLPARRNQGELTIGAP